MDWGPGFYSADCYSKCYSLNPLFPLLTSILLIGSIHFEILMLQKVRSGGETEDMSVLFAGLTNMQPWAQTQPTMDHTNRDKEVHQAASLFEKSGQILKVLYQQITQAIFVLTTARPDQVLKKEEEEV